MIRFRCSACGVMLQAPDDRAGRSGHCKACGTTVDVPLPEPVGDDDGELAVDLSDIVDRYVELAAEMIAHQSVEPWTARLARLAALFERLEQEEDPGEIRQLVSEAIGVLSSQSAAEAVRSGRSVVAEALLEASDELIRAISESVPGCRQALRPLRSSPDDEAFANAKLPDLGAGELGAFLARIGDAHGRCQKLWAEMTTEDDWKEVVGEFAGRLVDDRAGAVHDVVRYGLDFATAVWQEVTEASDEDGPEDDEDESDDPAAIEWDAAMGELCDAWDATEEYLEQMLPSIMRSCRHVLGTLVERTLAAAEKLELSQCETHALGAVLSARLRETEAQYAAFRSELEAESGDAEG